MPPRRSEIAKASWEKAGPWSFQGEGKEEKWLGRRVRSFRVCKRGQVMRLTGQGIPERKQINKRLLVDPTELDDKDPAQLQQPVKSFPLSQPVTHPSFRTAVRRARSTATMRAPEQYLRPVRRTL